MYMYMYVIIAFVGIINSVIYIQLCIIIYMYNYI